MNESKTVTITGLKVADAQKLVTRNVYAAISKVTAILAKSGISKNKNNAGQGYKFRGIDDVYAALAPALIEAQLVFVPRCLSRMASNYITKTGAQMFNVTVEVEFDLISTQDGSRHTVKTFGEAMDTADKATNKAMSAAYKYAAFLTFCIPTEGDPDADAHSPEPISQSKAPAPAPRQQT